MVRAVVVGRHRMLKAQLEVLRELGVESVEQVSGVDENRVEEQVAEWASRGVKYIIVQALPLSLLVRLFEASQKHGVDVLLARMKQVAVVEGEDEAEKLVSEAPERRTFLRSRGDLAVRVIEFRGWERIKKLDVELEAID